MHVIFDKIITYAEQLPHVRAWSWSSVSYLLRTKVTYILLTRININIIICFLYYIFLLLFCPLFNTWSARYLRRYFITRRQYSLTTRGAPSKCARSSLTLIYEHGPRCLCRGEEIHLKDAQRLLCRDEGPRTR